VAALSDGPRRITGNEFRGISRLLHRHTGINLVAGKETLVMGRLDKRLRQLGLRTYGEYLHLLDDPDGAAELGQLVDLLTTNETYFFREPRHFDFLRHVVVPGHRSARPLRVWSAASSSGEEAYTTAMVLADAMPDSPWEIIGTDVSARMVHAARRGIYPVEAAGKIPSGLLRRFCRKGRDEYAGMLAVCRELRERTRFVAANLHGDLHRLGTFDVILLRNVMIYFDVATKTELIPRLQAMLRPGGYFIVSLSETLNGIPSGLRLVEPSIYRLPGDPA
jgi:chemotaxis protein methyltransferase CheR